MSLESLALVRRTLILVLVTVAGTVAEANAQVSGNQAVFLQSGQTATLDCNGGKAGVEGSNNVLTIKGKCTDLQVAGSGNKIAVEFGSGSAIEFAASGNAVKWSSSDGKPPRISSIGTGNT
jgi:hypothetical protein